MYFNTQELSSILMICSVQSNTSNVTKSEIQSQNIQKKSLQIVQNIETIKTV